MSPHKLLSGSPNYYLFTLWLPWYMLTGISAYRIILYFSCGYTIIFIFWRTHLYWHDCAQFWHVATYTIVLQLMTIFILEMASKTHYFADPIGACTKKILKICYSARHVLSKQNVLPFDCELKINEVSATCQEHSTSLIATPIASWWWP